jgi:hypothetical protein
VAIDSLVWHKPVDGSDVKHALEIEKELGRERALNGERALDGELILEGSEVLAPARDLEHLFWSDDHLQPESKE